MIVMRDCDLRKIDLGLLRDPTLVLHESKRDLYESR